MPSGLLSRCLGQQHFAFGGFRSVSRGRFVSKRVQRLVQKIVGQCGTRFEAHVFVHKTQTEIVKDAIDARIVAVQIKDRSVSLRHIQKKEGDRGPNAAYRSKHRFVKRLKPANKGVRR